MTSYQQQAINYIDNILSSDEHDLEYLMNSLRNQIIVWEGIVDELSDINPFDFYKSNKEQEKLLTQELIIYGNIVLTKYKYK